MGSAWRLPSAARVGAIQQSSTVMYSYPAAFMPFDAIASTMLRTMLSSIEQPKTFQLFQPIGGVRARVDPVLSVNSARVSVCALVEARPPVVSPC